MHAILNSFSREVSRFFDEYFKEHKLATPYVELILLVHEQKKVSQKNLAEKLHLAPSTITRFVNKLVKKELVNKSKNGRLVQVSLTEKGKKLAPELSKAYDKARTTLENRLGEKYVHTTEQLIKHGADLLQAKT
jgi:DNA-binding MarR family transcriptional regulator